MQDHVAAIVEKLEDRTLLAAPVTFDLSTSTLHDQSQFGDVSYNASDPDFDPLTFEEVSGPANGDLEFNSDGTFEYTPDADYVGGDSFTWKAYDGSSYSNVSTVDITVYNNAPTDSDSSTSTLHDQQQFGDISYNASDPDFDALTFVVDTLPANGTLKDSFGSPLSAESTFNGGFEYVPDADYVGGDRFTWHATDGLADSDGATVSITVYNYAPTIGGATFGIDEDAANGTMLGSVSFSDPDFDTLSLAITAGNTGDVFAIDNNGYLTVNDATMLNYEETSQYSLTVEVTDGIDSDAATVTVNVNDLDIEPVFDPDSYIFDIEEDSSFGTLIGTVSFSDPQYQTVTLSIDDGFGGPVPFMIDPNGQITVGGPLDYETHSLWGLQVTGTDPDGNTGTASVEVWLEDVEEAPVFDQGAYTFAVDEDAPGGTVVGTLTATDPQGQTVAFSVDDGAGGSVPFAIDSAGTITVNGPLDFETQDYHALVVTGTDPDGNTDIATVDVFIDEVAAPVTEVDLQVFQPKVIDPNETEIPAQHEISIGAQTWVNVDNDDNDEYFDNADSSVPNGDNELVRIRLRLKPNTFAAGTATLTATTGGEFVQVWKSNTTFGPSTSYTLGSALNVPGEFVVDGEYLVKDLWVEGILPHTEQRATKLKLTYSEAPGVSDEVAFTILGVESVTFEGQNNSVNNGNTLDADPNYANAGVSAVRVFPDARLENNVVGSKRDKVTVKVQLTTVPVENIKVWVRSFDVDDPSSETTYVDPNDLGNSGTYKDSQKSYTAEHDNRGFALADGASSGSLEGWFEGALAGSYSLQSLVVSKDQDDPATIKFKVSTQPGDNYRIVAYGDGSYIGSSFDRLQNIDKDDGFAIADKGGAGSFGEDPTQSLLSPVLTVWRFLHVEVDSMGAVASNGAESNVVAGHVTEIEHNAATPTQQAVTVSLSVNLKTDLNDGSPNLSSTTPKKGRFEDGFIDIGEGNASNQFFNLDGNGDDFVQRNSGFEFPIDISATALPGIYGNAIALSKSGKWIQINLTDGSSAIGYAGGTITIAGISMTISSVSLGLYDTEYIYVESWNDIPFTLRDDDALQPGQDVPMPDTAWLDGALQDASIKPIVTTDNNSVAFNRNRESGENLSDWDTETQNSGDYWTTYLLGAFQGPSTQDNDYDGETTAGGSGTLLGSAGGTGAYIYIESHDDLYIDYANRQAAEQDTVVHKIGHLLWWDTPAAEGHIDPNTLGTPNSPSRYVPRYLNMLRMLDEPHDSSN